jgi:hypothetical protein
MRPRKSGDPPDPIVEVHIADVPLVGSENVALLRGIYSQPARMPVAISAFGSFHSLTYIEPVVGLQDPVLDGVVHAPPVSHAEPDHPRCHCAAKDNKPDPRGF